MLTDEEIVNILLSFTKRKSSTFLIQQKQEIYKNLNHCKFLGSVASKKKNINKNKNGFSL